MDNKTGNELIIDRITAVLTIICSLYWFIRVKRCHLLLYCAQLKINNSAVFCNQ